MRATVLDAFGGDVRLADVPAPKPGPGEVLIGVAACGVGLTLERARTGDLGGSAPRIVGHELGGTVLGTGPGAGPWRPGDRVTASFYLTCGSWSPGAKLSYDWSTFRDAGQNWSLREPDLLRSCSA